MAEQTRREPEHNPWDSLYDMVAYETNDCYVSEAIGAFTDWLKTDDGKAAIAAADAGKPSKEEFGKALDKLIDAAETYGANGGYETRLALAQADLDAARREVERMAGYGEDG